MKSFTGYMHGVNLCGWLSQFSHSVEHYKSFISEEDIRKIADMGADHVRLPIDFECIETESGEPLPFGYHLPGTEQGERLPERRVFRSFRLCSQYIC